MHCAITQKNWDDWIIMVLLLEHGADPNLSDCDGETPLHLAARYGREKAIYVLMQYGANANSRTKAGLTPLHVAVVQDNVKAVKMLLQHGANAKFSADQKIGFEEGYVPQTMLYMAVCSENYEATQLLVVRDGAKINLRCQDEKYNCFQTALQRATRDGNPELCEILLENGADPNVRWSDGITPLHLAVGKWGDWNSVVRMLVAKKALVDATDKDGWTPLHEAAGTGSLEDAEILFNNGAQAQVNATTWNDGLTPLHEAARKGNIAVMKFLLKKGASVNLMTIHGESALSFTSDLSSSIQEEAMTTLLNADANPNVMAYHPKRRGWSVLYQAVSEGEVGIIKLLAEHGADLDLICTDNGYSFSALQKAIENDDVCMVGTLVSLKANVHRRGLYYQETLLHHAASRPCDPEIVKILADGGVDVNARMVYGSTALQDVAERVHPLWQDQRTVSVTATLLAHGAEALGVKDDILQQVLQVLSHNYPSVAAEIYLAVCGRYAWYSPGNEDPDFDDGDTDDNSVNDFDNVDRMIL